MEVPLVWKLQVTGANQVKSTMTNLNSAFERGQISTEEYSHSLQMVSRESRKLNAITRTQSQIFLAMHPNINKMSRALSTMSSVSRTLLTIMNAVNLARLAASGDDSNRIQLLNSLAEAMRGYNNAIPGSLEQQEFAESIAVITAQIKELDSGKFFDGVSTAVIAFSTGLLGLNQGLEFFKTNPKLLKNIALGIKGIGKASLIAAAPVLAIGLALTGAVFGVLLIGAALEKFRGEDGPFSAIIDPLVEFLGLKEPLMEIGKFFAETLPQAIEQLGVTFAVTWELITIATRDMINYIVSGIEFFVNAFIDAINTMIKAYNRTVGKLFGKIQLLAHISLPQMQTNGEFKDKTNNEVSQPAGGSSGGSVGPSNTYITVQGSVISERELMSIVDDANKESFKAAGFTGYQ